MFASQSYPCPSANLELDFCGIRIKNNPGEIHKSTPGQNKCHQEKESEPSHSQAKSLHIIFLIHWPAMTTSKDCISIYFDNKHSQSIVIEAGYFNTNLLAALT